MTTVLDLIDDSHAQSDGTLRLLGTRESLPMSSLWRASSGLASQLARRFSSGESVAVVMMPTAASIVTLLACWQAGVRVVSLPLPWRGAAIDKYLAELTDMLELSEASVLFVDPALSALAQGADVVKVPVEPFPDWTAVSSSRALLPSRPTGSFVQFSSGSSGQPKGICLSQEAIASNIRALLEVIAPQPGGVSVSWLPLSHDMGLIGMCLAPWAAGSGWSRRGSGTIALMAPEAFVSAPVSWLSACSELRATITAAPPFALEMIARRIDVLEPSAEFDLSGLAWCVVGSDIIRPATLRAFARSTARFGLDPRSIRPAYGLAEASLGVTMSRAGHALASPHAEDDVASSGSPLPGVSVTLTDVEDSVGRVVISSPGLFSGYIADHPRDSGTPFTTKDLARLIDGELFVVGRADDIIIAGDRKLDATTIEAAALDVSGIRAGCAAAIPDGSGRFVLVVEPTAPLHDIANSVRQSVRAATGAAPSKVVALAPGTFPRTPSGKVARWRAARGDSVVAEVSFRAR